MLEDKKRSIMLATIYSNKKKYNFFFFFLIRQFHLFINIVFKPDFSYDTCNALKITAITYVAFIYIFKGFFIDFSMASKPEPKI